MSLLKPCARPDCSALVESGRRFCDTHTRADDQRRNRRNRRYGYNRAHWRALRLQRIIQAGGACELRLPGCTHVATHAHLDPRLAGNHDAATIGDVRACCASCSGAVDAPRATRIV